jgi:NitT/TauT family transport system substrate-binding protein
MEPGPSEAFSCTKLVAQNQADVGFPSPGVLTSSVDTGIPVIMVYNRMPQQIFDFAVRKDSNIKELKDLAGKTISLGDAGWQVIVDPILVEIGVDPKSVTYISAGAQWGQAVSLGQVDAALVWEGYRAQWDAIGLDLKFFIGPDFSISPSNGEVIRKSDLDDPAKRELYIKFFKAVSMGIHFTRINPLAAAQIAYDALPVVREQMGPKEALDFTQQLHWICTYGERELNGYGDFAVDAWNKYLQIIYSLGQTSKLLKFEDVASTELIKEINDFDRARVEADAKAFKLNDTWKNVKVTGSW